MICVSGDLVIPGLFIEIEIKDIIWKGEELRDLLVCVYAGCRGVTSMDCLKEYETKDKLKVDP